MINELKQDTVSTISVRLRSSGGTPATSVVKADVEIYYAKAGATPSVVALDASYFDWDEPDSANYPGLYRLTINATGISNNVLDTLGVFSIRLKDIGEAGFVDYEDELEVVARYHWDALQRILGLSKENCKLVVTATNSQGFMTEATLTLYEDNGLVTPITVYDIAVTYDVSGVLTGQEITEQ